MLKRKGNQKSNSAVETAAQQLAEIIVKLIDETSAKKSPEGDKAQPDSLIIR